MAMGGGTTLELTLPATQRSPRPRQRRPNPTLNRRLLTQYTIRDAVQHCSAGVDGTIVQRCEPHNVLRGQKEETGSILLP